MAKRNLNTWIVNESKGFRDWFDRQLYKRLKKTNHWELLERFKNKDVLVVGNGPSLKKTELDRIDMVSIGMNKIDLLFDKTSWRPDIIVCINGLVIKQNRKFFNSTDIILFFPVRARYLGIKNRDNVFFIGDDELTEFNSIPEGESFYVATVTYTALQIAAYLNPKSVNIVGVDHSFNKGVEKGKGIETFKGDDDNHFDPNYFKGQKWGLPDIEGSEVAYYRARKYFDREKIPIIDYTIGGKCPCFVRDDISKIYK